MKFSNWFTNLNNRPTSFRSSMLLLMILASFSNNELNAQTLAANYGAPVTPLQVTGSPQVFKAKIFGSSVACSAGGNLIFTLPAGFIYVAGSAQKVTYVGGVAGTITTAAESAVSIAGATLATGAIPGPGDSLIITYKVYAACTAIGGNGNVVAYSLSTPTCSVTTGTATSNAFNALNAKLNITNVTNSSFTGNVGSIYSREITISNNGFGTIDTIYLEDKSGKGLSMVSFSPTANVTLSKTFTANDTTFRFRIIVPGGLAQNQTFVLTENVKIVSCSFLTSALDAWYGTNAIKCDGQNGTTTAGATVNNSGQPLLAFSILSYPDLRCVQPTTGVSGNVIFKLKNTGAGTMVIAPGNLRFGLLVLDGTGAFGTDCSNSTEYIDTAQAVQVSRNGGTTWTNAAYSVVRFRSSAVNNGTPLTISLAEEISTIAAGDSVLVRFAIHDEYPTCCNASKAFHPALMKCTYTDACGSNPVITQSNTSAGSFGVTANPSNAPDAVIGSPYMLTFATSVLILYNVNTSWTDPSGYLDYVVTLPASLAPSLNGSGAPIPADNNISGALPITPGTAWDPVTRKLTLRFARSSFNLSVFTVYQLNIKTLVSGSFCGPDTATLNVFVKAAGCATTTFTAICDVKAPVLIHGCPNCVTGGAFNYAPTTARISYGVYSPANNGLPGTAPNTPVLSNLRLNRMLQGDTVGITLKAKIVAGSAGNSFTNLFAEITDDAVADQVVSASAVVYNSAGTLTSTITNIPVTTGTKLFTANAALGTNAPSSFNAGDSVIFTLQVTNSRNIDTIVKYISNVYAANSTAPTQANRFQCDGNYTATMESVQALVTNGTTTSGNGINGCGNDAPQGYALFYLRSTKIGNTVSRSGHFPYEIRPLWELNQARVILNSNLVLDSLIIQIAGQGASGNFIAKLPVQSETVSGNLRTYLFDASNLHNLAVANGVPFSEGFYFYLYPYWKAGCNITGNFTYGAEAGVSHRAAGSTAPFVFRAYGFNTVSNNGSQAPLTFTSPSANKTVTTNTVQWDMQVTNPTVGSKNNSWITEGTGVNGVTITSIQTLDGPGGNVNGTLPVTNGVYRIGSIAANTVKYLRINASYTNCVKDSINIISDYDCNAYPLTQAAAIASCHVQAVKLTVTPQNAALQISIKSQPSTALQELCNPLQYELSVLNPALGSATDLRVTVTLPPGGGVVYVPNTYQIASGTGSYVAVADANVSTTGTIMTFTIPSATVAALAGTDSLKIKFTMRTTACDFISGSRLRFQSFGTSPCGQALTGTTQESQRIKLEGAPENTNNYTLSSFVDTMVVCGNSSLVPYKFKMIIQGPDTTSNSEEINVTLPAPLKFDVPSIANVKNHLTTPTSIMVGPGGSTIYTWKVTPNVQVGDSIVFTANITATGAPLAALACGQLEIGETVTASFESTCTINGQVCSSREIAAEHTKGITIIRPAYKATTFTAAAQNGGTRLAGTVTLTHINNIYQSQNANVAVYHDSNNNGVFDTGDVLIGAQQFAIANQATQSFNFNVASNYGGNACPMIAVVTMDCACDTTQILYNCSTVVLPVELQNFTATAKACDVELKWKTAAEQNFSHFEVEYSVNGITYNKAGQIAGKNLVTGALYNYIYLSAPNGMAYYRLKIVDIDGNFKYSPVRTVTVACDSRPVVLMPNPTKDKITIRGLKGGEQIQVYGANGQLLIQQKAIGQQENIDLTKYTPGVYNVIIRDEQKRLLNVKVVRL